jgi:hypothetical protein
VTQGRTLSRDYKHVKRNTPGGQAFSGWVGLLAGLTIGLTVALAGQLGGRGIRVNCVAPGQVYTPMVAPRRITVVS